MPEMSNLESYPPIFRLRHLNGAAAAAGAPRIAEPELEDSNSTEDTQDSVPVPQLDLQCLSLDNLGEACKEWGLFRLVNHEIPPNLLSRIQELAKRIFSLSFESKQGLLTTPTSYFWGTPVLTPSGDALRGALNINWLEGINVPLSQLPQFQTEDPRLDDFRCLLEEYGRHLSRIAKTLFEAMARNLNLGPKQYESKLDESTGFIRVYRYLPGSLADEAWGMIEHTDSSVLSIVNQDHVGGLEIFKDDKWRLVNPISNTLIVHIGDMMQEDEMLPTWTRAGSVERTCITRSKAISDDKYTSVKHRVRVNKQEERFSICYFVFPAEGSVIHSSKYRPFTYTDFQEQVQKDTKTLGYKVGLQRFKA